MSSKITASGILANELTDEQASAIGKKIKELLNLRYIPGTDHFNTSEGTKTNRGLARIILRFMVEELNK